MGGLDDIDLDEAGWEDEEDDEHVDGPGFLGGMGFGFAALPGFLGGGAMPQASREWNASSPCPVLRRQGSAEKEARLGAAKCSDHF